jgi:hypothetical protein
MSGAGEAAVEQTDVGSYFVANYPPFSVWNTAAVADARQASNTPQATERPPGLYLHIPFCRKRCHREGVADWATKRRWVQDAFAALEQAGYHIGSAYTAVRNPSHTKFVYRDRLWEGVARDQALYTTNELELPEGRRP